MWLTLYGFLRLLLWGAGVTIALFPTLQTVHVAPTWPFGGMMHAVNAKGHFRDLFFVIVPAAAVSLSTCVDFLCSRPKGEITFLMVIVTLILNVIVLLSGFVGFLLIPPESGEVPPDEFSLYSWMILIGLMISVVSELWASGASERHRRRNPV